MKLFQVALVALLSGSALGAGLDLGAPAPEVQARLLDSDAAFSLSASRGKVVLINFWATWCAPCKAEMPLLQAYYEAHKAQGFEMLAISMDDSRADAEVRQLAQKYRFPVALKADSHFKGLGRIWRMPTTFVVDRQGLLRKNGQVGDAEITQAELDAVVTPLLAGH